MKGVTTSIGIIVALRFGPASSQMKRSLDDSDLFRGQLECRMVKPSFLGELPRLEMADNILLPKTTQNA